jgi:thymidylate synthase (FAD)
MKIISYNDIEVHMIRSTNNPLEIMRTALDITQKRDFMDQAGGVSAKTIQAVMKMNHGSVFEHVSYSFLILGASRSFLAQITRHRISSFTSGSQHYQDYRDYGCSVDESLIGNETMAESLEACAKTYVRMVDSGIPKYEARQVLPNAMQNNLLWTVNARSLVNFLNLRLCHRNTNEIMIVAGKILHLVKRHFSELFDVVGPDCFMRGGCAQGKMSCGRPWEGA